ncbi:diguanylate cyclase response regulator [Aliarcobacter skirrowii]|jgi:diguanylate cyclase (GGDEF)-like protein|uniref:diguanylate cyclase n=2 Tax=Aliarcobacter skirrowii TaxID=28200 RepID=A0AAD0WNR1_9BACT|nr:diguanylate cyclase [Aliarcobacter skirrowii]AXX85182.1 two-component system response regulator/diguanylate cyclase [Aliarcobacter skirrowii CCUG 10374]KAB0620663.1 diguanylate cyclase [Aliarcobacter skirrowii CCUG 10374]RXI25989.1 diguanylate cyclase response regulator [Aliarcobacter skirrowii CCUG 10374]RXJ76457.1 diguanylate cyclase response regulator [Aliarcobacter skirrowii]SUU96289.1 Stalked cell differentiation-controlling protein [Aliarcobacter skirrowii]
MIEENRATILIVDDMSTNLMMLSDILKDDYNIKISKTGEKAIELCKNLDIDLVLLDIEMPLMNGYEVCKNLKNYEKTKNIPIIFVSAKNSEEDEEYGLNLGAIDYISKPFSKVIIKARVKNQIKLKQKTELLEKLSNYDGLTNIKNRRYFDDRLTQVYKDSKIKNTNLALMMIDIDFFKPYNDNYGHGKGDEALKIVAKTLENSILNTLDRPNDLVARYGGEEFVVLLSNIDLKELEEISNRVVKAIRDENIEHKFSKVASYLTISLGAVLYKSSNDLSIASIMKSADEALYEVKQKSRDNFLIKEI